ncbi:MAG: hypothetical protein KF887_08750 [Paracoccaceae bacterium]|nr:MAG: hypothetical protein KF887_08750 [Paracoccaceae bacterium]
MKQFIPFAIFLLSSCASTSVTPVARNQIIINTSAAPVCGSSGAQGVAARMAAVETIRRGFERFVIVGAQSANNVGVIQRSPTYATTTGTLQNYGNTTYGNATTTFGGGGPMIYGSHDAALGVVMLNRADPGYSNGVDAKGVLGPKWQEMVEKGITTCGK